MTITFKKAVKYEAKGRVALVGPAGSGKSWTMLTLARTLVGPQGRIAAIDTEHGSLSKYADLFSFDVLELDSFSPDNFMAALKAAEAAGYDAFCADSLSHFWTGKDGALEYVDMASKRHRDQMGGWKEFRPHERAMVDAMIASPMHIIATMRTKTDYQEVTVDGKKKRVKVGLAPVQREGLEYEFDLVGYMDEENTLIVDKTRCPVYSGKAITKPGAKDFSAFAEWLKGTAAPAVPAPVPTPAKIAKSEQEALIALCRQKGVTRDQLLTHVKEKYALSTYADLLVKDLSDVRNWVMTQAAPESQPTQSPTADAQLDAEMELLKKRGISHDALIAYCSELPYATDIPAVVKHLQTFRVLKDKFVEEKLKPYAATK